MADAPPPRSGPRTLLVVLLGLLVFAATAEIAVRALDPTPRIQVVRLSERDLRWIGEHPIWQDAGSVPTPDPCPAPGGLSVLLVGDSIAVSGAPPEQTIGPRLATHLSERLGRPVCARVAARPGLPVAAQVALAKDLDPEGTSDLVLMLVWRATGGAVRAGDWWIETTPIETDAEGWPPAPLPVPHALHEALVAHSAVWRYATLALSRKRQDDGPDQRRAHDALLAWAAAHDIPVAFGEMPPLDRPFGEPWLKSTWKIMLRSQMEASGRVWVDVSHALGARGEDVEVLRQDTCCHYLPPGHDAVAQVLAEAVAPVLAE